MIFPVFTGTERFTVVRQLGQGGMGVVFEAIDQERGKRVALKTLPDLDGELLLRLKNEFRALHDLAHPNLVSLGELVEDHGRWFFTMEMLEGVDFISWVRRNVEAPSDADDPTADSSNFADATPTTLREPQHSIRTAERRRRGDGTDLERLRDALGQLAGALSALHSAGKVHRDIKPSNVAARG